MEPSDTTPERRKKPIFVGSSSADRQLALQVTDLLSSFPDVIGRCWTEEFPLGLMTFEALERMLRLCVGAVFIAVTPDGSGSPCDNVMIELGLVAGRMGRTRVALCTNDNVRVPSDLAAVTRIDNILSPCAEKLTSGRTISQVASERLKDWTKVIPAVLQGVPCAQVSHGYGGRWRVVLKFETWRSKTVGDNIAGMNADLMLHIPLDGQSGSGILIGKLTLGWQSGQKESYTGLFHVCASISEVTCRGDASMTFRTQTILRQAILQTGSPSSTIDALPEELAAPWIFTWDLKPAKSDPGLMLVTVSTDVPSRWTEGKGAAYKESLSSFW